MSEEEQGCPKFLGHQVNCQICGNVCLQTPEVLLTNPEDENYLLVCPNCAPQLGQCVTCAEIRHCDFETNSVNIPKQVQSRVQARLGGVVLQTTVRNPEREKVTCANGCICWNSVTRSCRRQNSLGCDQWNVKKV